MIMSEIIWKNWIITKYRLLHMKQQIAIIGGGNLGSAIAEGLINSGFVFRNN